MHGWGKRQNRSTAPASAAWERLPIAIAARTFHSWLDDPSVAASAPLDELLVLKALACYIANEEAMYAPFTSQGILSALQHTQGKALQLDVDAQQQLLQNGYGVLTLAFLVGRERRQWARASTHGHVGARLEIHNTTANPFVQALVHAETTLVLSSFCEDAVWVCPTYGHFIFKDQLMPLHKDYAHSIEAAHLKVFLAVRALDDYFHMLQNVGPMLDNN